MSNEGSDVTTWALVATTALGAAGWVTSTMRDRRTADSVIVTAATELVDRLTAEITRLRTEVAEVRLAVAECERKHAAVAEALARGDFPTQGGNE